MRLLFICLACVYLLETNADPIRENDCEAGQFPCNNGECISAAQKCDLKKDCADGTDETFEQCFDSKCSELKCTYGGCYAKNMTCDGKNDCWDATDEHILNCDGENGSEIVNDILIGTCRNDTHKQFQCQESMECIPFTLLCNGVEDCEDKSDELNALCVSTVCPENSFRCAYGACVANSVLCDHSVDCRDGSDELQSICNKKNGMSREDEWIISKELVSKAISENVTLQTPSSTKKTCTITANDTALRAKTVFNRMPLNIGRTVPHNTMIRLSCLRGYDLQGYDFNRCDDGSWKQPLPTCVKNCDNTNIANDPKLTNTCYNKGNEIDCGTSALVEGSSIRSVCAPGYKPKTSVTSAERKCTNGRWQSEGGRLQCVVDCGKTFNTVDGFPWVVSIYQRTSQSNYEYSCLGVIIDPSHVVTVTSCFSEESKPINVVVVLGKHTVGFNPEEEHGFDYFLITNIEMEKLKPIAVLMMLNPFTLSAKVRPVCADRDTNTNSPRSIMNQTVDLNNLSSLALGEPLVHFDSEKNLYYLTHIVNDNKVIVFNEFKRQVYNYLRDIMLKHNY